MKVARIELHYLPSLEYLCTIYPFDEIQLEKHEHYVKQSFRNRCYINTSQGVQMLIVPLREKHGKISVHEIKIDHQQKWQNNHWRSVESAYRNAPYFEYYSDDLKKIIYENHELLIDLNMNLLSFCLRSIGLSRELTSTNTFEKQPETYISDLRGKITPKKSFRDRPFYQPTSYQQVFGNTFVNNLSFLDLLFCKGPNSLRIIQSSRSNLNK